MHILNGRSGLAKVWVMDCQNEKSSMLLNKDLDGAKKGCLSHKLNLAIALKDVPLEVRRKEAKKPLFLIRYE